MWVRPVNEHCEQILPPEPDRIQWLKARRTGIGSSDVSAILGLSPYKTALQVWWDKLDTAEPNDQPPSKASKWGNRLEAAVAEGFAEETGKQLSTVGLLRSTRWPWMLASCDRRVLGEEALLECKTTSHFLAEQWKDDQIPDHAMLQVIHQLAVTGFDRAYVAVLIGGQDDQYRIVERDQKAIEDLAEMERVFWQDYVEKNVEPAAQGPDLEFLNTRRRPSADDAVLVGQDFVSLMRQWSQLGEQKRLCERQQEDVRALMVQKLGDAKAATLGDGNIIFEYRETPVKESYKKPGVQRRIHITGYGKELLR